MTNMNTNEPHKSIFPNNCHNAIEIDKAIKHNIGNGTFGFSAFFEKLNIAQAILSVREKFKEQNKTVKVVLGEYLKILKNQISEGGPFNGFICDSMYHFMWNVISRMCTLYNFNNKDI